MSSSSAGGSSSSSPTFSNGGTASYGGGGSSDGASAGESSASSDSKESKALLQGIWVDEETENVVFKVQGDTVFYPDSTISPMLLHQAELVKI